MRRAYGWAPPFIVRFVTHTPYSGSVPETAYKRGARNLRKVEAVLPRSGASNDELGQHQLATAPFVDARRRRPAARDDVRALQIACARRLDAIDRPIGPGGVVYSRGPLPVGH
jgi:hypothetical protein